MRLHWYSFPTLVTWSLQFRIGWCHFSKVLKLKLQNQRHLYIIPFVFYSHLTGKSIFPLFNCTKLRMCGIYGMRRNTPSLGLCWGQLYSSVSMVLAFSFLSSERVALEEKEVCRLTWWAPLPAICKFLSKKELSAAQMSSLAKWSMNLLVH